MFVCLFFKALQCILVLAFTVLHSPIDIIALILREIFYIIRYSNGSNAKCIKYSVMSLIFIPQALK